MRFRLAAVLPCALAIVVSVPSAQSKPKPKPAEKAPPKPAWTLADMQRRITAAHEWLVDHQNAEGYWSAASFGKDTARVRATRKGNLQWVKPGETDGDTGATTNNHVACTGLALLCFVGGGYDHKEGGYQDTVRKGVQWMRKQQVESGCFGDEKSASMVHDHAVATMAMAEIYGLSGDALLKPQAEKAVDWLLAAQNPGKGWRYGVTPGDNDTQMTAWCTLALKSAKLAGIERDYAPAYAGVNAWLDACSGEVQGVYRTGFISPGDGSPRNRATATWVSHPEMDAAGIMMRLFTGNKAWDVAKPGKQFRSQLDLLGKDLPVWEDKKVDYAYWYFATLALYQVGGADWDKWCPALQDALMKNQRGWRTEDKDTFEAVLDEHGSWDAVDPWYPLGGRIWGTTINTLMLQCLCRAERLKQK